MRSIKSILLILLLSPMSAWPGEQTSAVTDIISRAVTPDQHPASATAHQVFSQLLTVWRSDRPKPRLYVINEPGRIWAFSLNNGHVLISLQAVRFCLHTAPPAKDFLSFILAHEIAHHAGNHLQTIDVVNQRRERLAPKHPMQGMETQADTEGILLMSLAGFDPVKIINRENFLLQWAKQKWPHACTAGQAGDSAFCRSLQRRNHHLADYVDTIMRKYLLFKLATQAYMAGHPVAARTLFNRFAHYYPAPEVHINMGLTYMAQALQQSQPALFAGSAAMGQFHLPRLQATNHHKLRFRWSPQPHSNSHHMHQLAYQAFDKAYQYSTSNQSLLLNIIHLHLLNNERALARGMLEDRYAALFGRDLYYELLDIQLRIPLPEQAFNKKFFAILDRLVNSNMADWEKRSFLLNLFGTAKRLKKPQQGVFVKKIMHYARPRKDAMLIQSVRRFMGNPLRPTEIGFSRKTVSPFIPGDRLTPATRNRLRFRYQTTSGQDTLNLFEADDTFNLIATKEGIVTAVWLETGAAAALSHWLGGTEEHRLLTKLGLPDRYYMDDQHSLYAYDRLKTAFRVVNHHVAGWMLYPEVAFLRRM